MTARLTISRVLNGGGQDGEREFSLGRDVAYGYAHADGSCGLSHAPDQGMMDRVAAAVDALDEDDVAELVAVADGVSIDPRPVRCVGCRRIMDAACVAPVTCGDCRSAMREDEDDRRRERTRVAGDDHAAGAL